MSASSQSPVESSESDPLSFFFLSLFFVMKDIGDAFEAAFCVEKIDLVGVPEA